MSYRRLREDEWRTLFERFGQSGMTRVAFCKQEDVGLATFDAWRRRILAAGCESAPSRFIELHMSGAGTPTLDLPCPVSKSPDLTVELPYGVILRFHGVQR